MVVNAKRGPKDASYTGHKCSGDRPRLVLSRADTDPSK